MRSKPVVTNLVSIYFGSPRLWDTKKQTVKYQTIDSEMYLIF